MATTHHSGYYSPLLAHVAPVAVAVAVFVDVVDELEIPPIGIVPRSVADVGVVVTVTVNFVAQLGQLLLVDKLVTGNETSALFLRACNARSRSRKQTQWQGE